MHLGPLPFPAYDEHFISIVLIALTGAAYLVGALLVLAVTALLLRGLYRTARHMGRRFAEGWRDGGRRV